MGFPLIGTERFSFPAVINSFDFTPTTNRDGVYLGQSGGEANVNNEKVVREACELHMQLVHYAAVSGCRNIHFLADIPQPTGQPGLNEHWLQEFLIGLVKEVRGTPAVLSGQCAINPEDSVIPFSEGDAAVKDLWGLLNCVKEFQPKLPSIDEATGWRNAIQSWTTVQECDATGFREVIDGRKLAEYVEERSKQDGDGYGKVENLQGLLRDDVCAVEWLNRLFEFLTDNEFDDVIRSSALVLDQGGNLDKLSNLYRDKEIDDELKDIADSLDDVEIKRAWLRDSRLTALYAEVGKGDRNNNDVVRDIIQELKELADNEDLSNEFTTASVPLFGWLVGKQDWNRLRDLPIFSDNPAIGTNRPLRLSQTPGGKFDSERPLAPVRAWPEGLQCYSSLFPLSHTMADAFYDAVPTPESWKGLKEQGLLHVTVLQRVPRKANFRDHITVNALAEGGGHNAAETGTTTEISFFTRDTEGVMARVRDSRERGQLFWRFLTEWLAVNDSTGLSLTNDSCDCGETHEYYPGLWLVPVKDNRWVQTGNNARETLTARSLAKLFSDRSWDPSLMNEHPGTARLLKAIGVTQLDLALAFFEEGGGGLEDVESHLTQLMSISGGKGMSHVVQFAKDLKFDPDLPDHLAERRKRRKIVHKNQRIGSHVEDLEPIR